MGTFGGVFSGMNTSVSALKAERQRMEITVSNLANVHTTRTAEGGPYKRRMVVFQEELQNASNAQSASNGGFSGAGVKVSEVTTDNTAPIRVFRPDHPDADAQGYVSFPNIQSAEEMVDLISASRSYEANATAFKIARSMYQHALDLGKA